MFFIPFFPIGEKASLLTCNSCGQPMRIDSLQAAYEKSAKSPFYLYSGLILVALLVIWLVNINGNTQKQKELYVANPQAGDVYLVRDDKSKQVSYYFLKIADIWGDSVIVYHGNLEYNGFVSRLHEDDYFVQDEQLIYTKKELKQMLEKGGINAVERGYGNDEGFNRVK